MDSVPLLLSGGHALHPEVRADEGRRGRPGGQDACPHGLVEVRGPAAGGRLSGPLFIEHEQRGAEPAVREDDRVCEGRDRGNH